VVTVLALAYYAKRLGQEREAEAAAGKLAAA
jgi:hypothetical protein